MNHETLPAQCPVDVTVGCRTALDEACYANEAAEKELEQLRRDANRYRWLRDRMRVRYESPVSGGEKRATLTMRIGHSYLDSKLHPATGWTDKKYFDECREAVDAAIDSAKD